MTVQIAPGVSLRGFNHEPGESSGVFDGLAQWCVVTPDFEATMSRLQSQFGAVGFLVFEPAPLFEVTFRGEPINQRADIAFGYIGDVNVEVVHPRDDGDPDLLGEFLEEHPEGGFHHVGFQVPEYDIGYAEMESKFGPAVQEGKSGIGGDWAHFDTRATTGTYTEILWFSDEAQSFIDALRSGDPARLGA